MATQVELNYGKVLDEHTRTFAAYMESKSDMSLQGIQRQMALWNEYERLDDLLRAWDGEIEYVEVALSEQEMAEAMALVPVTR